MARRADLALSSRATPEVGSWAAALVAGGVVIAADAGRAELRDGYWFALAPLVFTCGLHHRTFGYLHDPVRRDQLPLPWSGHAHFASAGRRHVRGWLAVTVATLAAGLASELAAPGEPAVAPRAAQLACLAACAWGCERAASALAAWAGRRAPAGSTLAELQRGLSGGWTTPEAAVHLYTGAVAILGAALLATPAQLAIAWLWGGRAIPPSMAIAAALGITIAGALGLLAPRLYARGLWEAVPRLHETIATLAGPATPEPAPAWLGWLGDPGLRLIVLQWLRASPLPRARLVGLLGWLCWSGLSAARGHPIGPAGLALGLAAGIAWAVPNLPVLGLRAARRTAWAGTAVGRRAERVAWLATLAPTAAAVGLVGWLASGSGQP